MDKVSDQQYGWGGSGATSPASEEGQTPEVAGGDVTSLLDGDDEDTTETEATEVEEAREEGTTRSRSTRSRTPQFSWAQVEAIVEFATLFNNGSEEERTIVLQIFGWDPEAAGALDLAQGLYPAGGLIEGYRTFSDFASKVATNTLTFSDGLAITSLLSESDVQLIKNLVRLVNVFGGIEVRYRRNIAIPDVVQAIVASLTHEDARKDTAEILDWVGELLVIWPGESA